MARPRKTGLDYFPFDVDFFTDEKIICIGGEYGIKGELTVIKLLCAIYRNGYFIQWNDTLKYKLIIEMHGSVSGEFLEQVIRRLVERKFFDQHLFNSESVLTSEGIQRRYFEATKFRQRDLLLPYLLEIPRKNYIKTDISQWETGVSHWESTQIKRNKKKISSDEDNKQSPAPPPFIEKNFLKEFFAEGKDADPERKNAIIKLSGTLGFPDLTSMKATAQEIMQEWKLRSHVPTSWEDAASHLISTMRKRKNNQPPPGAPSTRRHTPDAARQQRQLAIEERRQQYRLRQQKAEKPESMIRRLGYDPAKVSLAQVLNPDWRHRNPPDTPPPHAITPTDITG